MVVSLPLEVALKQSERHAQVLRQALCDMPEHLSLEQMQQPDAPLLRLVDQFVLRFTKLQDTMGTHVLRQFAAIQLAEPIEDLPFIEVLQLLERHGYLTAEAWALQRGVRNALAHEYPEDPLRLVLALNDAKKKAQQLLDWLDQIKAKMHSV
jgi:uncharacterized protein YutE (UPF0331/DUF86 family)